MRALKDHIQDINNQKVIVRANYDVPIETGQVQDTTRIEDSVATIKLLREHQNQVILIAHYDRPDGQFSPENSLKPVVAVLEPLVGESIHFVDYQSDYHSLQIPSDKPVVLIDNLRFWKQEEENNPDFAQYLASLAQVYINEAFANCHRQHASIVGLPKLIPGYAGVSLSREMEVLTKISQHPEKPLVVVLGGAKLETKEPLVTAFASKADHILVGGKIAVDLQGKSDLPANVKLASLVEDQKDITEASAREFADIINTAKTVFWNGSMGVFEDPEHQQGTRIVAEAVNSTPAFTMMGGGDTETALTELNMESGIDYISTGGGAMLTFLSEGHLVGIDVLGETAT